MALAFANRSAVWNDRGEHALAIRDADLAFEAKYPLELQHKLYERKGQCLIALGKYKEAKVMLQTSIDLLEKSSSLKGERRRLKEKTLQKMLQDIEEEHGIGMESENNATSENAHLAKKYVRKLVPDLRDAHPKFPAFNNAVSVQYDPQGVRGRYCVASRDIEAGELLAVETPFVWLLDKESARGHCWHCFRPLLAPVPCLNCAGIAKTLYFW